jgi:hypothetical protein
MVASYWWVVVLCIAATTAATTATTATTTTPTTTTTTPTPTAAEVKLHGWNAFIALHHYPLLLCTVPKVGCTAMREWVLQLAPEQYNQCQLEITQNNSARRIDPACQSLIHFRNLTKYKKAGMTKFKMYCRQRHNDPSEYLLGKERCMSRTSVYSILRKTTDVDIKTKGFFTATFVRHPVDRFVSWFVDKVLLSSSSHNKLHVPRFFDQKLLSSPGFGVTAMIKSFWDMKSKFRACDALLDEHYASQSCMCRHDIVDYAFVGKLESMRTDFASLVKVVSGKWDHMSGTKLDFPPALPGDMNVKSTNAFTRLVRGNLTMEDLHR